MCFLESSPPNSTYGWLGGEPVGAEGHIELAVLADSQAMATVADGRASIELTSLQAQVLCCRAKKTTKKTTN
jgi:hypothetical protein